MNFYKYQGTGNDFIMVDNRTETFSHSTSLIHQLCDRRFGIGADGLILLENDSETDFKMVYYNADGNESTMCGNGGRCIAAFAHHLNIIGSKTRFKAIDGIHKAEINGQIVKLKMGDVHHIENHENYSVLNTGSPHYVQFVEDVKSIDVYNEGKKIRNNNIFKNEGINVNFVTEISDNEIFVRTYERGVEDETYSCGTGVTASALTFMQKHYLNSLTVKTLGGELKVYAEKSENGFKNVWLEGPAKLVFEGNTEV